MRPTLLACCLPLLLLVCGCSREEEAALRRDLAEAKQASARLSSENRSLREEATRLGGRIERLEGEAVTLTGQRDACLDRVAVVETAREDAVAEAAELTERKLGLIDKVEQLELEKKELIYARDTFRERVVSAQADRDSALSEVEKLTEDVTRYVKTLARIAEERPDIYPGAGPGALRLDVQQPDRAIRGKVTAVDPKLGLVVINAGQKKGVKKGYHFIVFRGTKYIGQVIVDETFADVSAAHYGREEMAGDVKAGDDVTTKLRIEE